MNSINNKCIICGNKKFKYKYYGEDYYYKTSKKKYEIIECEKCGLEQIFPTPSFKEQDGFYLKNYYSYNKTKNTPQIVSRLNEIVFMPFKNKNFELPKCIFKGQNFLDIGCGDGFNLIKLKEKGSQGVIRGFEISDKNYFDNNIYYGRSICDIEFDEKYDYIWCNHVFEHVDCPVKFLRKVHSVIKDDGVFVLTLPNVKSLMSTIFGKYASDRDIPRHLFGYSYNIEKLLDDNGFFIVNKSSKIQANSALSFVRMINDRFNYDIRNNLFLKILVGSIFLLIDFILSCFRNTNQMSFILKKKK